MFFHNTLNLPHFPWSVCEMERCLSQTTQTHTHTRWCIILRLATPKGELDTKLQPAIVKGVLYVHILSPPVGHCSSSSCGCLPGFHSTSLRRARNKSTITHTPDTFSYQWYIGLSNNTKHTTSINRVNEYCLRQLTVEVHCPERGISFTLFSMLSYELFSAV